MTSELSQLIKDRVGPDVDTSGLAVFEAISLNTKPLPGKNGSIHEGATITSLTLQQMADHINGGKHLPLISDHMLVGEPHGRVFSARTMYGKNGEVELRTLFYLDGTENRIVAKLNAGSLDEVSVSFMPTEFDCSACGWDYFSPDASFENLLDRTCANGHVIGENGVHAVLNGLADFIEVSLVARGAADEPKIVGQSDSKLAPATALRLIARGFTQDSLLVQATRGVSQVAEFDANKFLTDLAAAQGSVLSLTVERDTAATQLSALTVERDGMQVELTELTTERDTLLAAATAENVGNETAPAIAFLRLQLQKLKVAKGEDEPALDTLPGTVAELELEIRGLTSDLTAILPVGGVAQTPELELQAATIRNSGAFRTKKD